MHYYSKSAKGFFNPAIVRDMPSDALPISEADWTALLEGQAAGKEICFDVDGPPILIDPVDNRTYAQKREMEYPPMSDYLDGVVKGDQAQIDAYIAACLAVKAKYPKE